MSTRPKELPVELSVIASGGKQGIFDDANKYVIPLYQRGFAWEDKQIEQLIDDIYNFDEEKYYLGNLIVDVDEKDNRRFEVIDGQQRLTATFLLLSALNCKLPADCLSFAHRDLSVKTLRSIPDRSFALDSDNNKLDEGILKGFRMIETKLRSLEIPKFIEKLKRVIIIRVSVPRHTDLNKYFEIMNSRGEQLEPHDIIKAKLMDHLPSSSQKMAFANVWDACSDMDGYVQMHFSYSRNDSKRNEREYYFGQNWNTWESDGRNGFLFSEIDTSNNTAIELSIGEIAANENSVSYYASSEDENIDKNVRFESFITFPHLLLHTLKVYKENLNILGDVQEGALDDRKLIAEFESFEKMIPNDEKAAFSEKFVACLLKCRYLLDNFMLKREFKRDESNSLGEWSLKTLYVSRMNDKKYAWRTKSANYKDLDREILMLQSMLRVTYTSPRVMHWVTQYLIWLSKNQYNENEAKKRLEQYAKNDVEKYIVGGDYCKGLNTPHIVFNYLDFLLWKRDFKSSKSSEFKFEFRNSVEHWYPQHPTERNKNWAYEQLNHIGNLCIVSSTTNSKFSNNMPKAKSSNFKAEIAEKSLKLQLMNKITESTDWNEERIAIQHGQKMIKLLTDALALSDTISYDDIAINHQIIDEDESDDEITTETDGTTPNRNYWEQHHKESLKVVDGLINLGISIGYDFKPRYVQNYMLLTFNEWTIRIIHLVKGALVLLPIPKSAEIDSKIETAGLNTIMYLEKTGRYRIKIQNSDIETKSETIIELLKASYSHSLSVNETKKEIMLNVFRPAMKILGEKYKLTLEYDNDDDCLMPWWGFALVNRLFKDNNICIYFQYQKPNLKKPKYGFLIYVDSDNPNKQDAENIYNKKNALREYILKNGKKRNKPWWLCSNEFDLENKDWEDLASEESAALVLAKFEEKIKELLALIEDFDEN